MKSYAKVNVSFGLIAMETALYPLRDYSDKVMFKSISPDGNRVSQFYRDQVNQKEYKMGELEKGYEISKEQIIPIKKVEIAQLEDLTSGITILGFVSNNNVDESTYDKPYFLEPVNNQKFYCLLHETLSTMNMSCVVYAVIRAKEHLAVIRHHKAGLILVMLEKVKHISVDYARVTALKEEAELFKRLVEQNIKDFDLNEFSKEFKLLPKLKELIKAKIEGKEIPMITERAVKTESNMMDMLKNMVKPEEVKKDEKVIKNEKAIKH